VLPSRSIDVQQRENAYSQTVSTDKMGNRLHTHVSEILELNLYWKVPGLEMLQTMSTNNMYLNKTECTYIFRFLFCFVDSSADEAGCHSYTVSTQSLSWSCWIRVRSALKQSHIVGCLVDIRTGPTRFTVQPPSVHPPYEETVSQNRLTRYPVLSLPIARIKDKLITRGRSSISLFKRTSSVDVPFI
jgi:hypothetical protein